MVKFAGADTGATSPLGPSVHWTVHEYRANCLSGLPLYTTLLVVLEATVPESHTMSPGTFPAVLRTTTL